jgi:hypothetical protein
MEEEARGFGELIDFWGERKENLGNAGELRRLLVVDGLPLR